MLSSFPHRERDISIAHWNQPLRATTVKTSLVFAGLKVGVRVPIFKKSRKGLLFLTMVTIASRWERRLGIHKNVNATLVPLRTSVCGLRSQQVVSATLNMWQVLSLSHVFSTGILNQIQIYRKNSHLLTDLLKSVHTHINVRTSTIVLAWMFTGPHRSGPVMCLRDRGQILCALCGGYIAWEKRLKILLRLCGGQQ